MVWSLLYFFSFTTSASSNAFIEEGGIAEKISPFLPLAPEGSPCQLQIQHYLEALKSYKLWAFKMYDSSGKMPSGLLNGNVHALGDFWQCVRIEEMMDGPVDRGGGVLRGRYCQVYVYLEAEDDIWEENLRVLADNMLSHRALQSTYFDGVKFFPTFSPITWGFCVPDRCSHADVRETVESVLKPYNKTAGLTVRVKSSAESCIVNPQNGYHRGKSLPVMLFIWGMLFTAAVGAFLEWYYPKLTHRKWYQLVTAFSLKRNWRTLVNTETASDDIGCVHGIRFIFSMIIYLLHRSVFGMFAPLANRTEIAELLEAEWTMIFRAFWSVVDTFVILSGLLTSYYSTKKLQQGLRLNFISMYAQRYYKFTPLYVITVMVVRNVAYEVLTGPNSFRSAQHFITSCQENYWKAFFYIGNIDGLNEICYPPAHQLITDMQMYLIAPFVISIMWSFGRKGIYSVVGVIVLITLYKGFSIYLMGFPTFIYYGISLKEMLESGNQLYLNPIHRLPPYLIGTILGNFLRTRANVIKLSAEKLRFGWSLAVIAAYYAIFAMKHASKRSYVFNASESALFGMMQPIFWGISISWLIFICHTGQGGVVNSFLSWRGFIIFSRLSYAFYLVQIVVIFFNVATLQTPGYMTVHQIVDLNELASLILLSTIATLLFLLPLGELYNIVLNWSKFKASPNKPCTIRQSAATNLHEPFNVTPIS